MINKSACFVCATPYQIMSAIAIVQDKKLDADLYIFGTFIGYEKLAERIKRTEIFKYVITVDYEPFRHRSYKKNLLQILKKKSFYDKYVPVDRIYSYFYSTSRAHFKLLLFYKIKKRNPNVLCVYYEDGLGTYGTNISILQKSSWRDRIEFFMGCKSFSPEKTRLMASIPSLIDIPAYFSDKVDTMPCLLTDEGNKSRLKDIFVEDEMICINEPIIIFDVLRRGNIESQLLDDCYQKLLDVFHFNNIVCKQHPRSTFETHVKIKQFVDKSIPMEVLYLGMDDIERRILVGNMSTALFSPKLLFGKEPYVVSLHELLIPQDNNIKIIFNKMLCLYKNKNKIFAPKTLDEFSNILLAIRENISI